MRFRSNRNRLILIAFLLTVLSEGILICISYWNTSGVGSEIHQAAQRNLARHVESQLISKFNDISSLSTQFDSLDFINYSRKFYNLREPDEADRVREELNTRLNRLHLQPETVEQVYFIGGNKNQKNFGKSFKEPELIPEQEIPWIDDLSKTGLLDLFTSLYDMPTFIPEGMFTEVLNRREIPEDQRSRLQAFFAKIEGHLIVNNGVNPLNVLTIIVLNNEMFTMTIPSQEGWNGHIAVLDNNGHVFWSNLNDEKALQTAMERRDQGLSNWSQKLDEVYEVRNESISPYGINLLYFEKKAYTFIWDSYLIKIITIVFGTTLLINLAISYKLSNIIMHPFNVLSRITWRKENEIDLQHIPEGRFKKLILSKVPIRSKILLLLLTSVMIPFIAAVVLHVLLMNHVMFNKLVDSTVESSNQIVKELRNRMDSYESLTNGISADSRLTNLFVPYNYAPLTDDAFPVASYKGLADVSYFVLYNSQGLARYSSAFINNMKLFKLSTAELGMLSKLEPEQVIWLTGKEDVYDHPALMLIKKVSLPVSSEGKVMDAYLQVVLKEDAFQSAVSDRRESIVLLDQAGEMIYSSTKERGFTEAAYSYENTGTITEEKAQFGKVEASSQVVLQKKIPGTDWSSMLFYTIDDINLKINEMFYRYLLLTLVTLLVIFAMVWYLSMYLVKPIERLKRALEEGEVLSDAEINSLNPRDEIGLLVLSFNNMVTRINDLLEENINKQIREKELVTSKMKAELGMLQQQINPHFLYNTLEAINMRARQYGAMEVSAMVNSLAKIFRFTINTGNEVVPFANEIEHVRNYLTIQELRFKDAFVVNWKIDQVPPSLPVLKFILQPLVENALHHGIEELYEQGQIGLEAYVKDEYLHIQISDNGLGMDETILEQVRHSVMDGYQANELNEESKKRSTGVGLRNVYHRLRIYYGDSFELIIDSQEFEGTTVKLTIPLTHEVM
ncbi:sensor histidine kinase YesM [Paenibacillus anaericanus]|uniref:sensor histidine kinase n=1 Tax=Paenibacillus anaericanus TaxID=170367 RepID=UPI00278A77A9|nr:histidine kinase [Paenibacillus anaericanus]MDQ0090746.1 sensor histidine kinase YesM [Paenibacillus anaericanus]